MEGRWGTGQDLTTRDLMTDDCKSITKGLGGLSTKIKHVPKKKQAKYIGYHIT